MTDIIRRSRIISAVPSGVVIPPATFDPATLAWVAAVIANGGTVSSARETLVDNFIKGAKSDGFWTKLDRLWLHAGENTAQALTDLVADALATAVNSPTFTTDKGFTGTDGSTTIYIDSNFNPNSAAGHYALNAAHLSAWSNTNAKSSGSGGAVVGVTQGGGISYIFPEYSDGNLYADINQGTDTTVANANSTGHYIANRSGASATQGYINGSQVVSGSTSSVAVQNNDVFILAQDNVGSGQFGSGLQITASSIGGNLSSTDALNLYNRLCDFMGGAFADAWARQVVTNGGTVSAGRQSLVANLIAGGLRDGWWYKLDRLWLLANENSAAALTDIVADSLATAVNSPTFTTDRGFTGQDATTPSKYIDSGFNPSTAAGNYTQNAAHVSGWSVTNTVSTFGGAFIGLQNSGGGTFTNINDTFADGNLYGRINDNPASGSQGSPTTRAGHWLVNRSGASASQLYQNGSSFSSPNGASAALLNGNFFILGENNAPPGPGIVNGSPQQVAAISIGGNLSSTDVSNFYSRLRTYMTAVGVP